MSGQTGPGPGPEDARHVPPPEVPGHATPAPPVPPAPTALAGSPLLDTPVAPAPVPGPGPAGDEQPARGGPFALPAASWRWPAAVIGLVVGMAPEGLLYLATLALGTSSSANEKATAGSAVAIAVSSLVLYVWQAGAAWMFSLRKAGRRFALWGFRRPTRAYFWTIPVGLVVVYAFSALHDWLVHPKQQDIMTEFPRTTAGVILFVLVAVVMAPLFEEIVFRGFLFRGFANSWGWPIGALASGAIFGLAHLQLDVFLPLTVLGIVLAWVYHRTGSLWTSITFHALFNSLALLSWALLS